ncbi:Efflux transporter, RND family, MFP subunit [Candidatus Accumulibacter aalborgensis]|uniref:Efflux transporter, RND family, MFP subunit n=1 Tax=Candidatus Accumulibacter aalborgensis TaxID=1860102 RepID=A0A1A8XDD5_9PROT|nr:efflux RND transporter periplasmic adaptor subunit [Candidatus Accumulibacter aalborgensis]SBT03215.1 Efflux transporter, RND family, MFP subunit [Candidatus Accumulibacter aalborgensis]
MNLRFSRKAVLSVVAAASALLLGWLVTSQGPLAPTRVTVATVQQGPLLASTFGIGTVEARRSYALAPTMASRVARVLVDQGDTVAAGQLLAELDPVDLDDRVASGRLGAQRAASAVRAAQAQLAEAQSRAQVAVASARRSAELRARGFFSQEATEAKQQEANAATAAVDATTAQLAAARRDHERVLADVAGVGKLRDQARLVSPVDGIVSARLVEPGSTIVAGQAVLQVIDPTSLWVRARIDQGQAGGVRVGQSAEIVLRSDAKRVYPGEVKRVDWLSDSVAEERVVNVGFTAIPDALSIGDLVEVTIGIAELPAALWLPAAVKRVDRQDGVWRIKDGRVTFHPVEVGITTLDGRSQILAGLAIGDEVVVHSEQALQPDAKVSVVATLVGARR